MNAQEMRELSQEELLVNLDEARDELRNLRFQKATGELTDTNRMAHTRRLIARYLTVLNERDGEEEVEGEA